MKMSRIMSCLTAAVVFGVVASAQAATKGHDEPAGAVVPGRELESYGLTLCNIMYKDANYGGSQFTTQANYEWWNLGWFNDQMSSMITYSGCYCTVYWDANFLGSPLSYDQRYSGDSRVPWIGSQWNDKVSSIICYGS
jgi:hypothetical protein